VRREKGRGTPRRRIGAGCPGNYAVSGAARYQLRDPWHEFEQVRLVAFQPGFDDRSFTPFMCVAAFVVVELYPVPWHVAQPVNEWNECWPVLGGIAWQVPHDCVGGVQLCVRTGVPAHPAGDEVATVRVCVPLEEQALHAEYVYVQAGGVYVQACERTGEPPAQPVGEEVATERVWVLFDWQAPQAE
jgi:hypothetical protein